MPVVPQAERQETTAPLNVPQVAQPQEMGGGFEQVTQAAVGFGKQLQDIAAAQKSMIDKAVVSEADFRLSQLKSELEVKRNQLKGRDAAGALDAIQEEYTAATEEISQGLTNEAQLAAYRNRVQHYWAGPGGLYESTLKYSDAEINKYAAENFNAVVDLRVKDAIEKSSDPEVFQQSLAELQAIIKDRYADPAVAESAYNDHLENINAGIKQLNIETERALKREADALKLEANNDLSELFFDDTLTLKDIKDREVALGTDYERWVKTHKKSMEQKEKELKTGKKVVDDPLVSANLAAEAMTMPADTTTEDINDLRERVAKEVLAGKLTQGTGRAIISDAERTLTLDPVRKSSEDNVIKFFKNDYNNELYGEPGTPEARAEYNRQVAAFRKWSRANLDKEPVEYYERVSDIHKRGYIARILGAVDPFGVVEVVAEALAGPEVTPEQRRLEIEEEGKRVRAIGILEDAGRPLTEANIQYVVEQL